VDNLSDEEKSILQSQIYQRKMQRSLKSQLEIMLKDLAVNQNGTVSDYLKASYHNGYIGALYNINMQGMPLIMPIDPYLVHRAIEIDSKIKHGLYQNLVDKVEVFKRRIANDISRGIASSTSYRDIATWIRHGTKVSVGKSMRIVRTEGNRIYNAAALDCGKGAKERGCDLVKVWDSTLDMKTRPTHRECDGQVRELDEGFKNSNGEAKAPGQFGIASEDINCRCAVLIKPRWDVDGKFTKRDNQSGELKEFEGVKGYEEFKKRYWKSIDKSGESGIIGVEKYEYETSIQYYKRLSSSSIKIEQAIEDLDNNLIDIENEFYNKNDGYYDDWDVKTQKQFNRAGDIIRDKINKLDIKLRSIIHHKNEAEFESVREFAEKIKAVGGFERVKIDSCNFDSAENIYGAISACFNKVPKLKGSIRELRLEKNNDLNDYAWTTTIIGSERRTDSISLNKALFSDMEGSGYLDMLKRDVAKNKHPVGCDQPYATIAHEIGHAIEDYQHNHKIPLLYANNKRKLFADIGINLKDSIKDETIINGLSSYATEEYGREFLAEAWSEYICNPNPRPIAKAVGEYVIEHMK
ncbi:MAG: phage head morphogenesis protein, partial [Clostridiales bacterium]|nr:phage head morphogenesis protein [Clostridiales bacterium]